MKVALLADIHANQEAFQAVLNDLEGRGIDRIACLGDIVGYGPDPAFCVDKAMELVAKGALWLRGNHDNAIANPKESLNITALRVINWTRDQLSDAHKAFLAAQPLTQTIDDVLLVHASANDPQDWIYVTDANRAMPSFRVTDARVILVGHHHRPALYSCDLANRVQQQRIPSGMAIPLIRSRRWLGVIGSVGQPRDGIPQAAYAILDTTSNDLSFRRVPYDIAATVAKLRARGLPESLAIRLNSGV
jgi:diadenosine tetraphosphatase ApaH/serine/threonine PP2A family protein phosphatase